MFVNKLQIRLPRRVTAYFLVFGLAALVWLSVGAVYVAHWVSNSRSESTSLRWLGRGSDRIVLSYLRDQNASLQSLVLRHRFSNRKVYGSLEQRIDRQRCRRAWRRYEGPLGRSVLRAVRG